MKNGVIMLLKAFAVKKITVMVGDRYVYICRFNREKRNKKGLEQALKALVYSLSKFEKDFDSLYEIVIRNDVYKDVTREEVMKYYDN